ncbi:hypothetical protein MMC19_003866 [Ptychographa xylographoides]|nr:hypothetical protein [Ptychographa xylographoides]
MAGSQRRSNGPILPMHNGDTRHSREGSARRSHRRDEHAEKETMGHKARGHFVAMTGEFVGTFLFLFFALGGTQVANSLPSTQDSEPIMYISLVFGFSLLVNVWVFYRVSGGLFNPAVTLGMVITGSLPWFRGLILLPAQILASICASAVVYVLLPGPMVVNTMLTSGTSTAQGLFIEMFLTSLLVITVLMLAAEKSKATFLAPVGIGLSLFVAELLGVYYTGGSLNPVRSFGPCVVNRDFPGYHWIYWLGPAMGACLAAGYYKFVKFMNYEEANPGQDAIDEGEKDHQTKEASRSRTR